MNKSVLAAPAGPPIGSSPSSVDLDADHADAAPVIRVSEAGSIVVSTATAPAAAAPESSPSALRDLSFDEDSSRPSQPAAEAAASDAQAAAAPAVAAGVAGETASAAANGVQVSPSGGATTASAVARGAAPAPAGAAASVNEPRAAAGPGVLVLSSFVVVMLVSYASAMTLLCVYLIFTRPSTLDLPDLAPKKSKTKNASNFPYFPMEKEVLPANVMRLGESRQFGSVRVTPVRVTRGSVEFSFYKPGEDETRAPEGPVLKLHLRFDNVSRDQEFAPFDRQLVYTKVPDKQFGWFNPNNFVSNVSDRTERSKHVYVFEMSPNSEWLVREQNLDHELKPGDFVETFIPTTPEDIETLSGDLVWRVQFRKGYNPKSLRGVTTLIEVLFNSSEIIDERPVSTAPDAAKPESKDA